MANYNTSRRLNQILLLAGFSFIIFLVFQEDLSFVNYSVKLSNKQMLKSLPDESDCTVDWFIEKPFKWIPILKHEENKYFSPLEIKSIPKVSSSRSVCPKKHLAEACCIGSRSNGVGSGNVARGGCYADSIQNWNIFEQSYPVNYKRRLILEHTSALYNMADVYRLLEGRRLLFKGDSVMNQNFDNMICDLQRNTGYQVNLNVYKRVKQSVVWQGLICIPYISLCITYCYCVVLSSNCVLCLQLSSHWYYLQSVVASCSFLSSATSYSSLTYLCWYLIAHTYSPCFLCIIHRTHICVF